MRRAAPYAISTIFPNAACNGRSIVAAICHGFFDNQLEQRDDRSARNARSRIYNPTIMSGTLSRVLPRFSSTGYLDVPSSEWIPLRTLLAERFSATLHVHEHGAGEYHGRAFEPLPHLLIEVTLDEDSNIESVIDAIDPMIEEIIDRNTTREFASSR